MEQGSEGGATVLLESYESTCDETVPLHPSPAATATNKEATVAVETVPLSSPTAAKVEEEEESKEEPQPLTGAQLEEVKKEEGKN